MSRVAEMFVDGAWTSSLSGETFTADSPATGETIGEVPRGTRDDARLAIGAANRAAGRWAAATAFERAAALHRVADEVEKRREELARTLTLDQGKPITEAQDEVEELVQYWRDAAEDQYEEARETGRGKPATPEVMGPPIVYLAAQTGETLTGRILHHNEFGKSWP